MQKGPQIYLINLCWSTFGAALNLLYCQTWMSYVPSALEAVTSNDFNLLLSASKTQCEIRDEPVLPFLLQVKCLAPQNILFKFCLSLFSTDQLIIPFWDAKAS